MNCNVAAGRSVLGQPRHLLFALCLAVASLAYVYARQSQRATVPDHGDAWADMLHLVAADKFNRYGYARLCFGLTLDDGAEIGLQPSYFPHWPPFPAIIVSLLFRLGLSTEQARIVPLLVSHSALIAVYLVTRRVLGDWRAGIAALLALASSAPFRLLSDSFAYPSYDFAAKAWTFLFITLGTLSSGWRRLAWLVTAGVAAFATLALSGFEMAPAIGSYSVLFPLLFTPRAERLRTTLLSALFVAAGLLGGMLSRIVHNACMLGGAGPALTDFAAVFARRSFADYGELYGGQPYLEELLYRLGAYYPLHLTVTLAGVGFAGLLAYRRRWRPELSALTWLGVVLSSESLWFILLRQHSHEHVHTIDQVAVSGSIAVALAVGLIWTAVGHSTGLRYGALLVGAGLLITALAGTGVRPYGNLPSKVDWSREKRRVETMASRLPANAVVVLEGARMPGTDYFLGRTSLRGRGLIEPIGPPERPWFLMTRRAEGDPIYEAARTQYRLLSEAGDLALFALR